MSKNIDIKNNEDELEIYSDFPRKNCELSSNIFDPDSKTNIYI